MSAQVAVILPIALPLATMAVLVLAWKSIPAQKIIGVGGSTLLLISAAALWWQVDRNDILVLQVGNWPAPFGITLVADRLSAIMVLLAGLTGLVLARRRGGGARQSVVA